MDGGDVTCASCSFFCLGPGISCNWDSPLKYSCTRFTAKVLAEVELCVKTIQFHVGTHVTKVLCDLMAAFSMFDSANFV